MSNLPTDPNDPVLKLYDAGFDVALRNGHLIVSRIPYLSPSGIHEDGRLVLPINDSAGIITDSIGDHTIWFVGDEPRDERDAALATPHAKDIGDGLSVSYMFSFKPLEGMYPSLYEKVIFYSKLLRVTAQTVNPDATERPGPAFQSVEDGLPLVYRDTNTTRAGLTKLNNLFRGHTVAIIGLGGTGSYILDQVAKTWVDRIILVDGDKFENHNAFRAPGAATKSTLQQEVNKAEYFAAEYSRMHTGIDAHGEALTANNLQLIEHATFVFLAAADATERPAIMAWLSERQIPFIDVGMGISETEEGLTGLVKVTMYPPGHNIPLPERPAIAPGDDDYATNIQVADLNALNAQLAVIEWKKFLGFYARNDLPTEIVYKLFLNEVRNGEMV